MSDQKMIYKILKIYISSIYFPKHSKTDRITTNLRFLRIYLKINFVHFLFTRWNKIGLEMGHNATITDRFSNEFPLMLAASLLSWYVWIQYICMSIRYLIILKLNIFEKKCPKSTEQINKTGTILISTKTHFWQVKEGNLNKSKLF